MNREIFFGQNKNEVKWLLQNILLADTNNEVFLIETFTSKRLLFMDYLTCKNTSRMTGFDNHKNEDQKIKKPNHNEHRKPPY